MQFSKEQFEQMTGTQVPDNVELVTRGELMPQQNGAPNQYGNPMQNGAPNQYGAPDQYGTPMQNSAQNQYNNPVVNGVPNQYSNPVANKLPQPVNDLLYKSMLNKYDNDLSNAMPDAVSPNSQFLDQVPEKHKNGPHAIPFLISVLAIFAAALFIQNAPYFALSAASLAAAAAAFFYGLDVEPYRQESKFTCKLISFFGVLMAAASMFAKFAMPDNSHVVIGGGFALVGLACIAGPFIRTKLKLRRCTESVRAVCIGLKKKRSSTNHHHGVHWVYAPTWQYMIGGHSYVQTESVFSSPPEFAVGDGADIMVNPSNPIDICRGKSSANKAMVFMGILITVLSVIYMIFKS
ncbi:hypothetical protein [Ruminococcus sp.]|uniref:hypothetical protein n=1 Tax=Ruminococcus sp. TaxID=41978 RepID=UPI0025FC3C79|nr:hypothetical protein [Ruminococcus sp.]MBQ8967508.1 hypothetical protein [Ruminococcus sp.]